MKKTNPKIEYEQKQVNLTTCQIASHTEEKNSQISEHSILHTPDGIYSKDKKIEILYLVVLLVVILVYSWNCVI